MFKAFKIYVGNHESVNKTGHDLLCTPQTSRSQNEYLDVKAFSCCEKNSLATISNNEC